MFFNDGAADAAFVQEVAVVVESAAPDVRFGSRSADRRCLQARWRRLLWNLHKLIHRFVQNTRGGRRSGGVGGAGRDDGATIETKETKRRKTEGRSNAQK